MNISIGTIGGNLSGNIAEGNITVTAPAQDAPTMTPEIAKLTEQLKTLLEQQRDPTTAAKLWKDLKAAAPAVATWFLNAWRQPLKTLLIGIDDLLD